MSDAPPARQQGKASGIVRRLSINIPNYNYGRYVRSAIESALHVDWSDVEVIVVDDGSTDDSWDVISAFGDQVIAVRQSNSGPRVACNEGFARSTGDVVIFSIPMTCSSRVLPRRSPPFGVLASARCRSR